MTNIETILKKISRGELSIEEGMKALGKLSCQDLGFARVDLDRSKRCGMPEVIFCEGKTVDQIILIMQTLVTAEQNVLATRVSRKVFNAVVQRWPEAEYHEQARCITLDVQPPKPPLGKISVVAAGTSDMPVAEEACVASERMGAFVERVYDVGVAGLHRLMPHVEDLRSSNAVIVVAGFEGALPSVVGGLLDRPVIAVPTSVGYGLNLKGLTALLAMVNSCVAGITVVNIDNGFGAGIAAGMINRSIEEARSGNENDSF